MLSHCTSHVLVTMCAEGTALRPHEQVSGTAWQMSLQRIPLLALLVKSPDCKVDLLRGPPKFGSKRPNRSEITPILSYSEILSIFTEHGAPSAEVADALMLRTDQREDGRSDRDADPPQRCQDP